jgi:hypothetical protein
MNIIALTLFTAAALSATPLTLTIHTGTHTYVVHGTYNAMVFDISGVTLDYTTDRIFCSDFSATDCNQVLP